MALTDTFDRHDGSLEGYSIGNITTVLQPRKHYDIRSFTSGGSIIPWTVLQMELWNYHHFEPYTMLQLETGEQQSSTSENWTNATQVGPDSNYRYSNTIRRSVTVGTPQTVTSTFTDDILTDFSSAQFIELVLRDFPAQAAGVRLDLANSFIDFTSSATYDASLTDSIRFNQSSLSLTGGGNVRFRIDRSLLTKVNLSNITGIRFRLTAAGTGTMTFIASALRLIPQTGYAFEEIDVETKRKILARSVPAAGGTEPSTTFGWVYFNQERPIDNEFYVRFHNGVNPVGNDNLIGLAFRHSDTDNDAHRVLLSSRSTQSRLAIQFWDGTSATILTQTPINTNILAPNKDYFLKVELDDDRINAGVYNAIGSMLGTLVYETGWQTMAQDIRNGYVGYSFEPYHYDFYIDYMGSTYSEFGSFESTIFESRSYVNAATLWEYSSKNIELFTDSSYGPVGDVISSELVDTTYTIQRSGNDWFGGVTTQEAEYVGDSRYAQITGQILAIGTPRGKYRIVIRDTLGQVVWRATITPVVKNQWRTFNFLIRKALMPDSYTIQIHQTGYYPDSFKIRGLSMNVDTVAWFGSNDGGATYYPWLNSINGEYTALHFPTANTQLRVRAYLMDNNGWIQGYKLKPVYMTDGHELSA